MENKPFYTKEIIDKSLLINKEMTTLDDKGNVYIFSYNEETRHFILKQDDKIFFESNLFKLKEVDFLPVSPFIINNKLYLVNYDFGTEIHDLNTKETQFFRICGSTKVRYSNNLIFFEKIRELIVFDVSLMKIIFRSPASDSRFRINKYKNFILFHLYKYNDSYLYDALNKKVYELPNFCKDFIPLKLVIKDNKIVTFYKSYHNNLPFDYGVYIYDYQTKKEHFFCNFIIGSGACFHFLHFFEFEFNETNYNQQFIFNEDNYEEYLKFLLNKFGYYCLIYKINKTLLENCKETPFIKELKLQYDYMDKRLRYYHISSNSELKELYDDITEGTERLKNLM